MMKRIPETEVMDDAFQAKAYDEADFSESHGRIISLFRRYSSQPTTTDGKFLDIGCGSGDVLQRFAEAFKKASFLGVDGSEAMIDLATSRMKKRSLNDRVGFHRAIIPADPIPEQDYTAIISNSFLHHLHEPNVLWEAFKKHASSETDLFVYDLHRPNCVGEAAEIVERLTGAEPDVLKKDFFNSLCAAFTVGEIQEQLLSAKLALNVVKVSDIHVAVFGRLERQF